MIYVEPGGTALAADSTVWVWGIGANLPQQFSPLTAKLVSSNNRGGGMIVYP